MNRRDFLVIGSAGVLAELPRCSLNLRQNSPQPASTPGQVASRQALLVRAGFTRQADGATVATSQQQTVVRSADSEGRLAAFVVPVGVHDTYRGAPLHVHHQQDEWIHILTGEFVAEVGGKRIRLKSGDSLLMPMKIPHRWSVAGEPHCGAVHLYTPAGLMDTSWDLKPGDTPEILEQHKAEFEKHGLTLLGNSLTKEEIDLTP